METNTGRDPPKGLNVFLGWALFCVVAFLGVAFCLPGEDPMRGAIWAGAASAAAALVLSVWWAVGYVPSPTEITTGRQVPVMERPFVIGAVVSAVSWFIIGPAYVRGHSPLEPWWCFVGICAFAAAGIVVHIMRGGKADRRLLAFTICMVLWTALMIIGHRAMNVGVERPLIGVLLGAAFFLVIFKPWRKD